MVVDKQKQLPTVYVYQGDTLNLEDTVPRLVIEWRESKAQWEVKKDDGTVIAVLLNERPQTTIF